MEWPAVLRLEAMVEIGVVLLLLRHHHVVVEMISVVVMMAAARPVNTLIDSDRTGCTTRAPHSGKTPSDQKEDGADHHH